MFGTLIASASLGKSVFGLTKMSPGFTIDYKVQFSSSRLVCAPLVSHLCRDYVIVTWRWRRQGCLFVTESYVPLHTRISIASRCLRCTIYALGCFWLALYDLYSGPRILHTSEKRIQSRCSTMHYNCRTQHMHTLRQRDQRPTSTQPLAPFSIK